jgi:MOSC domain-containing protein YiiM
VSDGSIIAIFVSPQARRPLVAVDQVRAVPGQGLEGDRYFLGRGSLSRWPGPDREVSFIEQETLEAVRRDSGFDLSGGRSRRNVVTAGLRLLDLKGRTFRIGTAIFRGVGPCTPCRYLEGLTEPGVFNALKGRGGLRAQVMEEGILRVHDAIEILTT